MLKNRFSTSKNALIAALFFGAFNGVSGALAAADVPVPMALLSGTDTAGAAVDTPATVATVWDLSDIYASLEAWEAARQTVLEDSERLASYAGTLDQGSEALALALTDIFDVMKTVYRVYVFTSLKGDEDVRIAENQALRLEAQTAYSRFLSSVSWLEPELLQLGEDRLNAYVETNPDLDDYRHFIDDVMRGAPHILSASEERILVGSEIAFAGPSDIFTILSNGDFPWPTFVNAEGETVLLDRPTYSQALKSRDRSEREAAFNSYKAVWTDFEGTFGAILSAHLAGLQVKTVQRGYDSSVQRALFEDNMPEAVYETLIAEVDRSIPTLHRFLALKKRMLGIEGDMYHYDLYLPLVNLDKTFSIETSIALTRQALEPLGPKYMAAYDRGVADEWMHVYPQPGKRSGAYMNGSVYDVHPYVLLNHKDDYDSASTFAHEYGHAVHSVLSISKQPFVTAGYSTFIAEIASMMNEILLHTTMVESASSPEERLYYLGFELEQYEGAYYTQAMFAEFEHQVNALADEGAALTGAKMSEIYLDLMRKYNGHESGIVTIDERSASGWASVPHFYRDFYVFQYATSIAAASSLAEMMLSGDSEARDRFITLLEAGGSGYSYDLLKAAGVDLAQADAHRALDRRMNAVMDEMEQILDEMDAAE